MSGRSGSVTSSNGNGVPGTMGEDVLLEPVAGVGRADRSGESTWMLCSETTMGLVAK